MDKELTHNDPEFLPVQYNLTQERLNQLAVDYDPDLIPHAEEVGDEGYEVVHAKAMAIVKVRTNIENVRKDLKKDSLDWGRKVDGEAKRLTKIVADLEAPWKKVKFDLEEAERLRAEAEIEAERVRLTGIENLIAGMRELANGLINADTTMIQSRIDKLKGVILTEKIFEDYLEAATVTKQIVGEQLAEAYKARDAFEMGQVAMEVEQKKLAEEKAELKRQQQELETAQAAQRASEDAAKALKLKAEQDAADEEQRLRDEQDTADAAKQALAAIKANEKKNVAYLKKRLPQDIALRKWADGIDAAVDVMPDVSDMALISLVSEVRIEIVAATRRLYNETQGGAPS